MRTERLERYREERSKCLAKLDSIQARIKVLDQKITECENLEIRALMKTENMSIADLLALVREMQEQRRSISPDNGYSAADTEKVASPFVTTDRNASYYGYTNDEEENESNDEI